LIRPDGLRLVGNHPSLPPGEGLELSCAGACAPDSYDYAGLTTALSNIKAEHPAEQNLILVPSSRVAYDAIIRAMDAARSDGSTELFPYVVIAGGAE